MGFGTAEDVIGHTAQHVREKGVGIPLIRLLLVHELHVHAVDPETLDGGHGSTGHDGLGTGGDNGTGGDVGSVSERVVVGAIVVRKERHARERLIVVRDRVDFGQDNSVDDGGT